MAYKDAAERAYLLNMVRQLGPLSEVGPLLETLFEYQSRHNPLYARYLQLLGRTCADGPFAPYLSLPIRFFKTHTIQTGVWKAMDVFTSSATTGQTPSRHMVRDLDWYLENTRKGFVSHYGDPSQWRVLALLPSYLERGGSSLVAMADYFIRLGNYPESGFFLDDFDLLAQKLRHCQAQGYPTLLLGVSFALLDFAEKHPMDLHSVTIMETGGMKGRRRELTRSELHDTLRNAFQVENIHSEYGMTELFSQAYSTGNGRFFPAPTLRVWAAEANDPFCPVAPGKTGVLQCVDLANVDTCAFLATEDLGKVYPDGSFEVLGRLDTAELRGCNLMVE